MKFINTKTGIKIIKNTIKDELPFNDANFEKFYTDKQHTHVVYDLLSGKEFLNQVESGCIRDEDGIITNIFVDKYNSNLGLDYDDFSQGKFLVSSDVFAEICSNHEVLVNWANK